MSMYHALLESEERHPYHNLSIAVLRQAITDYLHLGRRLCGNPEQIKRKHIEGQMKSISRFLLSDWYSAITGRDDGDLILEKLDRTVFGDD